MILIIVFLQYSCVRLQDEKSGKQALDSRSKFGQESHLGRWWRRGRGILCCGVIATFWLHLYII